jgi:hypothetical protein
VFTSIKEFVAEAINGTHTTEEVLQILNDIEQGIGLSETDRKLAEEFERPDGTRVQDEPLYQEGIQAGVRAVVEAVAPVLEVLALKARCPICGRDLKRRRHQDECKLAVLFASFLDHEERPHDLSHIPEVESATIERKGGQEIVRITTKQPANDNTAPATPNTTAEGNA